MLRGKPDVRGRGHPPPTEVVPVGDGRRARCLGCGERGPVRPDPEGAMRALRDAAGHRSRMGA